MKTDHEKHGMKQDGSENKPDQEQKPAEGAQPGTAPAGGQEQEANKDA